MTCTVKLCKLRTFAVVFADLAICTCFVLLLSIAIVSKTDASHQIIVMVKQYRQRQVILKLLTNLLLLTLFRQLQAYS